MIAVVPRFGRCLTPIDFESRVCFLEGAKHRVSFAGSRYDGERRIDIDDLDVVERHVVIHRDDAIVVDRCHSVI